MSAVRPMRVHDHAGEKVVTLRDALRFADDRVAEAIRLEREYGAGLEVELANDARMAHPNVAADDRWELTDAGRAALLAEQPAAEERGEFR